LGKLEAGAAYNLLNQIDLEVGEKLMEFAQQLGISRDGIPDAKGS